MLVLENKHVGYTFEAAIIILLALIKFTKHAKKMSLLDINSLRFYFSSLKKKVSILLSVRKGKQS